MTYQISNCKKIPHKIRKESITINTDLNQKNLQKNLQQNVLNSNFSTVSCNTKIFHTLPMLYEHFWLFEHVPSYGQIIATPKIFHRYHRLVQKMNVHRQRKMHDNDINNATHLSKKMVNASVSLMVHFMIFKMHLQLRCYHWYWDLSLFWCDHWWQ